MRSPSILIQDNNKVLSFPPRICHSRESGNPVRGKLRQESRIQKHGFTLIEMIVSMAILVSIMGLGMFLSLDYYRSYIFYHEKDLVVSLLYKARSQSLANINEKQHGVTIDNVNKKYTIFEKDAVTGVKTNPIEQIASPAVTIGGMSEVVFEQLNGRAIVVPAGSNLTLDGIRSIIISINHEGGISQN